LALAHLDSDQGYVRDVTPTIDTLVVADPPTAWAAAGFTVDDGGTCVVGQVRVDLVGRDDGRKRILSWSLRDIPPGTDDIDGLATTVSGRKHPSGAQHANGVTVIDHLVVMTPDVARTVAALGAAGIEPRQTRDVDPVQYGFAARQTFFRLGEVILELIGPAEPMGDGPASFFGLAYTVRDIDALPARYGEHLGRVKDAVQPGRRIATLRHKELGLSVATAFMTPDVSSAPSR
jgi:hypothetical protein